MTPSWNQIEAWIREMQKLSEIVLAATG